MFLMRWLPEVILLILVIWAYIYQVYLPQRRGQKTWPMFRKKHKVVEERITAAKDELVVAEKTREAEKLEQMLQEVQPGTNTPASKKTPNKKKGSK